MLLARGEGFIAACAAAVDVLAVAVIVRNCSASGGQSIDEWSVARSDDRSIILVLHRDYDDVIKICSSRCRGYVPRKRGQNETE